MAQNPAVRVIANQNNKNFPTVNILTTAPLQAGGAQVDRTFVQFTAAQAAAAPGTFKTVQAAASLTAGLKSIVIPGYSGPN